MADDGTIRYDIHFAPPDQGLSFTLTLTRDLAHRGELDAVFVVVLKRAGAKSVFYDGSRPAEVLWVLTRTRVERIDRQDGDSWVRGYRWPVPVRVAVTTTGEIPDHVTMQVWP